MMTRQGPVAVPRVRLINAEPCCQLPSVVHPAATTRTTNASSPWSYSNLAALCKPSPHDRAISSLAFPAVLALAADPLLQVVDTLFVGRTGPDALAALGVNSALFSFAFVVFNFLATATTPLVAAALASGDKQRAGIVTCQALFLATVLGGGLAVGLTLGADQVLTLMGADPGEQGATMFAMAKDFMLVRALASPAVLLMTVGQGVFRGIQDMRTPLGITVAANAVNLTLDVVLIFGLGLGVKGAAVATSVAEWVAALSYVGILWGRRDELGGLDVRDVLGGSSLKKAAAELTPFLAAGGAVLMRTALLLGTKAMASATAARLGPVSIASHQVVMQLWLLSSLVIDSLAVAGQSLVAVELGRRDVSTARDVSNRLLQLGIASGTALMMAFWAAAPVIPSIFSNDAEVQASVASILPLAVGMLPINAAVYVLDGVLVGSSDFKWMAGAMVLAAATAVGLLLGVEPMDLGVRGVWGALAVLMTTRLATLTYRYISKDGPFSSVRWLSVERNDSDASTTLKRSISTEQIDALEPNVVPVKPKFAERKWQNK